MKYIITNIRCSKRSYKDSYEDGQDVDGEALRRLGDLGDRESLVEVFNEIVPGNDIIKPKDIYTCDPNIYMDDKRVPDGYRVVDDRMSKGRYRACYDRQETYRGRKPSEEHIEAWKLGKDELWQAYYEVEFEVRLVCESEQELAKELGISYH